MYRKNIVIILVMFATICLAGTVNAISLQEARDIALRQNLNIKVAAEKIIEVRSTRKEIYTELFPTISINGYVSYVHNEPRTEVEKGVYGTYPFIGPIPAEDTDIARGENDTYKIAVQLEQPIFTGGRIYYSYLQSRAREEGTEWDEKETVQNILLAVEQAYLSILKAEATKELAEQHEKTMKAHLKDMESKYEKGRASLNDVLTVKVEVARAQEKVITTTNNVTIAKERLNLILNRPVDQHVEAVPVEDPVSLTITLEEAEEIARANRPEIKGALSRKEEAIFNRRVAEADYYPDISFLGEYSRQTDQSFTEPENWLAMVKMEYPIWQWGGTNHKVSAARAVERQSEHQILAVTNQIIADVRKAWLQVREADKRIEVAKEAVTQAEENLRIIRLGFDHGVNTSTDLLDAESLRSETRAVYIQAKYDAHFARTVLRYVTGRIEEQDFAGIKEEN